MLGNADKIIIGFDEKQLVIGIKAYNNEKNSKIYDISKQKNKNWLRIGCKGFIGFLGTIINYNFNKPKKYKANYDNESKTLIIFLK